MGSFLSYIQGVSKVLGQTLKGVRATIANKFCIGNQLQGPFIQPKIQDAPL